jgi:hypothetical protein
LGRRKVINVALPAAVAVTPVVVGALKDWSDRSTIWLWGDQALIDIEARDSLLGRNLLGVYDRYGWHHLGPIWLLLLGLARWLGGGSPIALEVGFYVLQAVAIVGIVLVAYRLRPSALTAWWAAVVVVGYEWTFGLERLGTVWAPYAIALPAALLVLLVADVAASQDPWPSTIAAVVCASFLLQTDIGTGVLALLLILALPFVRVVTRSAVGAGGYGNHEGRAEAGAWGWATPHWRRWAAALEAVLVVIWLPTLIQQFSTRPGNVVQAYRFLMTHHSVRTLRASLSAADTLFGSFPFRTGERAATADAKPAWLFAHAALGHPWYLLYIAGTVAVGVAALVARKLPALALAASSCIGILAAGWSILLVYGPLFPYLVLWTGSLVIPAWIALWLVLVPAPAPATSHARPSHRRAASPSTRRITVPLLGVAAATAVCVAFTGDKTPLTDGSARFARGSWHAVAGPASARGVRTIYVDIKSQDAMPEAAAIADQVLRHGQRLEVNRAALYFFDPSFAPRPRAAQLSVVVCCGEGDPGRPGPGLVFRGRVGGQRIYTLAVGSTSRHKSSTSLLPVRPLPPRQLMAPRYGHLFPTGYEVGNLVERHALAL